MEMNYCGFLQLRDPGDAIDILYIDSRDEPLAEVLEEEISGHTVTVRYWVADKQITKDEAQQHFIAKLMGAADCEYDVHYSDVTGYLWTDQEIKIGGHDLMAELQSFAGRYLILEVEIHD